MHLKLPVHVQSLLVADSNKRMHAAYMAFGTHIHAGTER